MSNEVQRLTLDQVIDIPFVVGSGSKVMAKVDNPVVPVVRAASNDSMDSLRMA